MKRPPLPERYDCVTRLAPNFRRMDVRVWSEPDMHAYADESVKSALAMNDQVKDDLGFLLSEIRLAFVEGRRYAVCIDGSRGEMLTFHNCADRKTAGLMLERFARQMRDDT